MPTRYFPALSINSLFIVGIMQAFKAIILFNIKNISLFSFAIKNLSYFKENLGKARKNALSPMTN